MPYPSEYLDYLIRQEVAKAQIEKDKIVSEQLIKNGFEEIEKEFRSGIKRNFPNLLIQVNGTEQVYIANDGTSTGRVIVLFQDSISFNDNVCKIKTNVVTY